MARQQVESEVTGNVWKVLLDAGADVAEGDVIMILESMKMETEVNTPHSGTVNSILVQEGANVQTGDELIHIS